MITSRRAPLGSPLPGDLTGSKVGRFLIHAKLGAGGMGEVYYAQDTKLRRRVALKRLIGNDAEASERILGEAQRASTLNSEHIASVYDVLEEQGELFIVMEYVEGENLRQRLYRPISLQQFLEIATQCADGLISAHKGGIIHCDIKPENIMLTSSGLVKILDFGLAKHLPLSEQSSTFELTNTVAGTPAYMAPEVLLGTLPDPRSDIFSLGVVFYEMLTQHHPFLSRSGLVATSERILHETPSAIRTFNQSVPEVLEATVLKAMAKVPSERYAHADELLKDLRLVRSEGMPNKQSAGFESLGRRAKNWVAPFVVAGALVVVLFLHYKGFDRKPILAERGWVLLSDFETSEGNPIPDKGVREGLTIALEQSHYVNVFPRSQAYEVLERMAKRDATRIDETLGREICQRENLQVLLTGSIEHVGKEFQITVRGVNPVKGGLLFAEQERFNGEDQFFEKADNLATRIRRDLGESLERIEKSNRPLARVTTPSLEALQLYSQAKDAGDQGKSEQIPGLLKGALRLDPAFAMAHLQLGQYYSQVVGKNEKAAEELEQAYRLRQDVTDREQGRIEAAYYNLHDQDNEEAQSLSVLVNLYPDDEEAHHELAGAYFDLRRIDKAVFEERQVLKLNPSSAPAYRGLVLYLAYENQPEAAITAAREALEHGVDPPQMHWGLGLAYLAQGEVSRARQEFQRIGQETETDRDLEQLCMVLADLYEGKLNTAKAKLAAPAPGFSRPHGSLETFRRYLLGRIYLSQGNLREARLQANLILRTPSAELEVSDLLDAGVLYARAGQIDQAAQVLRLIDNARKQFPSSSNQGFFHDLEGEIELADARPALAEASFTTAIQDYVQVGSHIGLARTYQAERRWDLAAREWEQVLQSRGEILHYDFPPDLAYAQLELGRLYSLLQEPDIARTHYEEMIRMDAQAEDFPAVKLARREFHGLTTR
jgi:serine/threonine protein kinase/tetratricopeptide (TPR) repeat protein